MGAKQVDLVGKKFGRLTVISFAGSQSYKCGTKKRLWNCACSCGGFTTLATGTLTQGGTKSCGCIHSETSAENGRKSRHLITKHPSNRIFLIYETNAKKRGIEFSLTPDDVAKIVEKPCFYCGSTQSNAIKKCETNGGGFYSYNGIDRVDNELGYTKENTVSCCRYCNHAKRNYSIEHFILWASKLVVNMRKTGLLDKYFNSKISQFEKDNELQTIHRQD